MKRENVITIIGYAIVFLFVYTALSKLFAYHIYLYDLERSPDLSQFAVPISIVIPGAELFSAILIMIPRWKRLGFLIATILMGVFTLYVTYVLIFSNELPCTCGGIIRELSWPQHLVFNIVFTIFAATGLRLSSKATRPQSPNSTATAY